MFLLQFSIVNYNKNLNPIIHPRFLNCLIQTYRLILNCLITLAVSDFHIAELMEGKVALFNMWDRAFTEDEVNSIDCLSEGNLLSMSDMSVLGPANLTEEHVPCETGKERF